jgi:hypothetical protein
MVWAAHTDGTTGPRPRAQLASVRMVLVAAPVTPIAGVFAISSPLVSDASMIESCMLKSLMMSICRKP